MAESCASSSEKIKKGKISLKSKENSSLLVRAKIHDLKGPEAGYMQTYQTWTDSRIIVLCKHSGGMYDTPRHLKVPSLLIAISLSWLCTFVSFEAATPFEAGTGLPFESVLPSPWGRCNADSL